MLRSGDSLLSLSRSTSIMLYKVDGIDQAKFRVPRQNQKSHGMDTLIRPALHVQGCWAHGFGFHFAVADQDLKKDTTTNLEVIARMSESIYQKHGGMPLTLTIIQDNCARECKNSLIIKVIGKWVIMKIHKHVWLTYPEKGHSHGTLDAVFGQATVKLGNSEFDDDEDVVKTLQGFLTDGSLEPGTDSNAVAYKLDQAAQWVEWADADFQCKCTGLVGPLAPHSFHICQRQDLSCDEVHAEKTSWPGAPPPHGGDLVVAIRSNMSDRKPFQVALMAPHQLVKRMRLGAEAQPKGIHERRPFTWSDRDKIILQAKKCFDKRAISQKTLTYLTEWCMGKRRQNSRPKEYGFLQHRWSDSSNDSEQLAPSAAIYLDPKWARKPRLITMTNDHQANEDESAEGEEDMPLQVVTDER